MSQRSILFPRIGAVLDGGPADDTALHYIAAVAKGSGVDQIHIRTCEDGVGFRAVKNRIRRVLTEFAGKRLANLADVTACNKRDLDEVLVLSRADDLNLLVAGRHLPSTAGGHTSYYQELARKSPCNTLLVTQHSEPLFERILVATDFSEHSARAVKLALSLQNRLGTGRTPVVLQHVFPVPYKSSYVSGSRSGFAGKRRSALGDDFTRFTRDHGISRKRIVEISTAADHPSRSISDLALARGSQLVVVGSRGRSKMARLLMGSTATELVSNCAAPVLVVKKRGENMGFLDALLKA